MLLVVVGLTLIASLGVGLAISILGDDSLTVPRGLSVAVNVLTGVLLATFVYLAAREWRRKTSHD